MAGLRPGVDFARAKGARRVRTRQHASESVPSTTADTVRRLSRGASWTTVSDNVKRLVHAWETEGEIAGRRLATRKDAIRCAVSLSLRAAGRHSGAPR